MQTYSERAAQVAYQSSIAVMVLLSHDNTDLEFWRIGAPENELTPPEEYTRRRLRPVGVVGLSGLTPLVAFREPLDPVTVNAIGAGFLEYLRVGLGAAMLAQMAAAECMELRRMFDLPDSRSEFMA